MASVAQFEREVTGEPLGYKVEARKLLVDEAEATPFGSSSSATWRWARSPCCNPTSGIAESGLCTSASFAGKQKNGAWRPRVANPQNPRRKDESATWRQLEIRQAAERSRLSTNA